MLNSLHCKGGLCKVVLYYLIYGNFQRIGSVCLIVVCLIVLELTCCWWSLAHQSWKSVNVTVLWAKGLSQQAEHSSLSALWRGRLCVSVQKIPLGHRLWLSQCCPGRQMVTFLDSTIFPLSACYYGSMSFLAYLEVFLTGLLICLICLTSKCWIRFVCTSTSVEFMLLFILKLVT